MSVYAFTEALIFILTFDHWSSDVNYKKKDICVYVIGNRLDFRSLDGKYDFGAHCRSTIGDTNIRRQRVYIYYCTAETRTYVYLGTSHII